MNKPLTAIELLHANSPVTKREKLMRLAYIVRSRPRCPLYLFNNIEYLDRGQWKYISHPASAFALAAQDKVLRGAGLEDVASLTRNGSSISPERNLPSSHVYAVGR